MIALMLSDLQEKDVWLSSPEVFAVLMVVKDKVPVSVGDIEFT